MFTPYYFEDIGIIATIILAVFTLSFVIQLFYYLFFYLRIALYKVNQNEKLLKEPLSVIICSKNEAVNLEKFLPSVLGQNYPDFEVIVVNDSSTDGSEDILKVLKAQFPALYVTTIPTSGIYKSGKKLAVSIGLKAARNRWVVMTDADCEPVSTEWLNKINEKIDDHTDFVIGYGGYFSRKGFLNRLIRFDTFFIAIQYLSFAMARIPYMGVGRNMAYQKAIFFENKGFTRHLHLVSGDDDLFFNDNAKSKKTKVVLDSKSITRSVPEKKLKTWFYQKKRHLTTGGYYKVKHLFLIGLENLSRIFFYGAFIAGLFYYELIIPLIIAFFIRYFVQLGILYKASVKLKENGVYYLGIIFDFILPIINFIVHLSNIKLRKRIR
jgi:poly-beta-1,6-N-acetyl-D-glucosamine synthase